MQDEGEPMKVVPRHLEPMKVVLRHLESLYWIDEFRTPINPVKSNMLVRLTHNFSHFLNYLMS